MPQGDVETFHQNGQWQNRIEGTDEVFGIFDTKAEAQAEGRDIAIDRKVEHIVRKENGEIGERNSYGNDPRRTAG